MITNTEIEWWVGEKVICKGCGSKAMLEDEDRGNISVKRNALCQIVQIPCLKKCGNVMSNYPEFKDVVQDMK